MEVNCSMIDVKLIGMTQYLCSDNDGDPIQLIARAGRVCYKSSSQGKADDFVRARIRQKHFSVTEHIQMTFEISGISRTASHQLVRHRIASYSMESMRYVGMENAKFVTPPSISQSTVAKKIFNEAVFSSTSFYKQLRELGIKKEDCRFVLPLATETKLVMSMNIHSLRRLFQTRLSGGAQWEIRLLAERMLEIAYKKVPSAFEDLYTIYVKGKEY